MTDRYAVLARIRNGATEEVARLSYEWLAREDTKSIGISPAEVTVYEAARTWRLRAANLSSKGKYLAGSDQFFDALGHLNPNKKLTQLSFGNSQFSGSVFFEKTNGRFVGVVVKSLVENGTSDSNPERLIQFA